MEQNKNLLSDSNSQWAQTKQALYDFIQAHGTPGVMPTSTEVRQAGNKDLDQAIHTLGGYAVAAAQFGLSMRHTRKPDHYWNDFSHLEREILDFIQLHGTLGIMPTQNELNQAGRGDLVGAIAHNGGVHIVADHAGLLLSFDKKPHRYWQDFANVEHELLAFIEEHGTSGIMPTREELRKVGRHDLLGAITKHGGVFKVAERLHLQPSSTAKPNGYWNNFTNVEQELLAFIQEHGIAGVMPALEQLNKLGRSDLVSAIAKHGKSHTVAKRLGLQLDYTAKPSGYWKDFSNIEQELLCIMECTQWPHGSISR